MRKPEVDRNLGKVSMNPELLVKDFNTSSLFSCRRKVLRLQCWITWINLVEEEKNDNASADDDDEYDLNDDGDNDRKEQDDDDDSDQNDDDNLNCLENGEHGKGVEALANDCHHIRVVSIGPYFVFLVIFLQMFLMMIAVVIKVFAFDVRVHIS